MEPKQQTNAAKVTFNTELGGGPAFAVGLIGIFVILKMSPFAYETYYWYGVLGFLILILGSFAFRCKCKIIVDGVSQAVIIQKKWPFLSRTETKIPFEEIEKIIVSGIEPPVSKRSESGGLWLLLTRKRKICLMACDAVAGAPSSFVVECFLDTDVCGSAGMRSDKFFSSSHNSFFFQVLFLATTEQC